MTQIAVAIDQETKLKLTRRLKNQWITTKGFFMSCINAYLDNQLKIGVITNSDPFSRDIDINESFDDVLAYMQQSHERTTKTVW